MITPEEIESAMSRLQLPPFGREYVKRVTTSPPSRRVRSPGMNVVCRFPSKKMGVVIQAESHRHELVLLYLLEHDDPDVIGFWDQPEGLKITYISASGRLTSPTITPDYLVIRNGGVQWIEVKPVEALPELAREMPNRYMQTPDGKWHCPPAEAAAQAYGLSYHIWTPSEVNPTRLRNIQLLADYFDTDINSVPSEIRTQVKGIVQERPGISIAEVRQKFDSISADHIQKLIAHESVYVDLSAVSLALPQKVKLFCDRETAYAYLLLTNGKYQNRSSDSCNENSNEDGAKSDCLQTELTLTRDAAKVFSKASPEDLAVANRRYRILTDVDFAKENPAPKRTVRRWQKLFRIAEDRYAHGFLGLIPRFKDRGNRGSHFSDDLLSFVDGIIDSVYCTASRPNKRHVYDRLRVECQEKGHSTPSYPWFRRRISMRSQYALALSREGKRVAHKYEIIGAGHSHDNHGAFPWEICLTDHTLVDVELICSETGGNLGRPWLSILIDGFSRRLLAFCLTFDPPSYRTLMMLVRHCVERHNRLPGCLVVDGGKEFQSGYFETLTAAYGVAVKRRPPGKARFGSIVERLFGTLNTTFFHTLEGNTQNLKNIRQLTKSMNPKGHATYTLEELHEMLSHFAFEYYENRVHPALNCSPARKYAIGVEISGAREHRSIANDEAFFLMTLPTTPRGTAKVQPSMGVKVNGHYYWTYEMRSRHFEGKSVRVKYDPENLGVVWAYLGDQWIQCRPNGTMALEGKTEKEMQIATAEWRRSRQILGHTQTNSQKAFAQFLKSTEAAKALRLQQAKTRAVKRIRSPQINLEPSPVSEPVKPVELAQSDSPSPSTTVSLPEDYGDLQ